MSNRKRNKSIIYLVVLLLTVCLTVGFSAFQNELFINDILLKVRLQRDVRVSESVISKSSGAVVNDQEYNKTKLLGNVTFDSTSSYVLYKVDLTNYGNVKSGLLNIEGDSGLNISICDSNASNCTNDLETPICNGSNCTLGATKEVYVKVSPTTSGTKDIDLDLDIQPYVNITYDNIRENTSDFKTEVLETSTYQITLTSKPEEVEVSGDVTASYDKTTGVLVLSNIQSDLTIQGKYLINTIAETSYTGTNPDNYVRFNNSLFRIITKENIDDGYGNTELRTKITSNDSIGTNVFDDESNEYGLSSIKDELNTTYYNSLNNISKELIDTVNWTSDSVEYVGLIKSEDYPNNSDWLIKEQYTLTTAEDNKVVAVTSTGLVDSEINVSRTTFPVVYLKTNVLIVGGNGTESNPYILDLSSNGLQPNPTVISGRNLTVTGSNQELVTVSNKVGTVYYNSDLNPNIPTASEVGTYEITYYIPEGNGYKAKTGSVTSTINGLTFTIAYQKGANVSDIGASSDSCTTTGSSLTCSVTLPEITPNNGYESVGWSLTNGDTTGVTGTYTLSSTNNNITLYANAVVQHNYQNTTTLAYYGTLNDAFSAASNNQTIKVLQDVTETITATLASSKTGVKLDLNGKTIIIDGTYIRNNGELDIYNSFSTDSTINSSGNQVIYNSGTLTLNETSNSNRVILNKTVDNNINGAIYNVASKTIKVNDNVEIKVTAGSSYGIRNNGTVLITGGSISGYTGIYNSSTGEVNINGSGTQITGTSYYGINNAGTTTIDGGTITSTTSYGIKNDGTATITGGTISGSHGIDNSGTSTITGGSIVGKTYGIYNRTSGLADISGNNTQITGQFDGIINYGNINASGGMISGGGAISNQSTGILTLSESAILEGTNSTNFVVQNVGSATITGGTMTGYHGLTCSGTLSMSGGTVTATLGNGLSLSGSATITGGTITGAKYGIEVSSAELTLGVNDDNVVTSSPVIQTVGTSSLNGIRLLKFGDEPYTFNFYDGVIKSASGSGYAISYNPTNIAEGYKVQKTVSDGVESAILVPIDYKYINTSTNDKYETLNEAFSAVSNNQIIKVLENVTETTNSTLSSGKTGIKLDLNGKTINMNSQTIDNKGSLDIYNSSGTDGTIQGGNFELLLNEGTLTLNETSSTNKVILDKNANNSSNGAIRNVDGAQLTVNSNAEVYTSNGNSSGILNYGTLNVNGGKVSGINHGINNNSSTAVLNISGNTTQIIGTSSTSKGIENNGTLTITGGTITGVSRGIYNYSTGNISISGSTTQITSTNTNSEGIENNGTLTITGGTVSSSQGAGLSNYSTGNIIISGNTTQINGNVGLGVSAGTVTIKAGTVTGSYYAIGLSDGTLTLGENNSTVSTTSPLIQCTGTASNNYGIYVPPSGNYTFNFYDGIITSASGSGHAISNNPTEIVDGYEVKKEVNNGIESAYLVKIPILMAGSTGIATTNYLRTNIAKQDIESITFTNSLSGHTANGTDCWDVSLDEDGSVLAWVTDTDSNSKYEMTIGANGIVYASSGNNLFRNLTNLDSLNGMNNFDTSKVTNMSYMFYDTGYNSTNFALDLGNKFDTSNVTDMRYMFYDTGHKSTAFTLDLGDKFDTSNVTNMIGMFSYTGYSNPVFTLDLGDKFDTSNVTYMREMFNNARRIKTIYAPTSFVTTNVTDSTNMFTGCNSLVGGQGTAYNSSNPTDKTYAHIDGGTSNPGYFTEKGSLMATFYYNSNTTSGGVTISNTVATCKPLEGQTSCIVTVPSVVTSSVGKYNSAYKGVSTSTGNMNSSSLTISDDTTFYANYSSSVTIYYPTSTTARDSYSYYRNEYFTNNTEMNSVIGVNNTDTTNANIVSAVSGYNIYGFSSSPGTNNMDGITSVSLLANNDITTVYEVIRKQKTATFYYNSNTTSGSLTVSTATSSGYEYIHCTSTAAEIGDGAIEIPSAVSNSVGKYNSPYRGVSDSLNSMTSAISNTNSDTYYAIYTTDVSVYAPTSVSERQGHPYKRNEFFTSNTQMSSVIAANEWTSTNFNFVSYVEGYNIYGFADNPSTNTRNYSDASGFAASDKTTSYIILRKSVTATFYYNSNTTAGSLTASTATANGNQYLRCTSTAAETSNGAISVPSAVSSSVGKQNSTYKSVHTNLSNMGSVNPTTGNTTYYANYSGEVTNNYYNGSAFADRTIFRNEFFTSNSTMEARLSLTNNSTANYTTDVGPNNSIWECLCRNANGSTVLEVVPEYTSVQDAADTNETTLYTIYDYTVYYAKGSNVLSISKTSETCRLNRVRKTCTIQLPTFTPILGYDSVGWSTTNGDTTGTEAGKFYIISSNGITLYANAAFGGSAVTTKFNVRFNNYSTLDSTTIYYQVTDTTTGSTSSYNDTGLFVLVAITDDTSTDLFVSGNKIYSNFSIMNYKSYEGYGFKGWYTQNNCGGTRLSNGRTFYSNVTGYLSNGKWNLDSSNLSNNVLNLYPCIGNVGGADM